MNPVSAIADCIASIFKWMTGRNATKNAAPIQQGEAAQKAEDAKAKTEQAIKKQDTNEIRNELAE